MWEDVVVVNLGVSFYSHKRTTISEVLNNYHFNSRSHFNFLSTWSYEFFATVVNVAFFYHLVIWFHMPLIKLKLNILSVRNCVSLVTIAVPVECCTSYYYPIVILVVRNHKTEDKKKCFRNTFKPECWHLCHNACRWFSCVTITGHILPLLKIHSLMMDPHNGSYFT